MEPPFLSVAQKNRQEGLKLRRRECERDSLSLVLTLSNSKNNEARGFYRHLCINDSKLRRRCRSTLEFAPATQGGSQAEGAGIGAQGGMLTDPLPSPQYSGPELTPGAPLTPGGLIMEIAGMLLNGPCG